MPSLAAGRGLLALVAVVLPLAGFGCEKYGPLPDFDAARAFGDLEKQVAFGPRVPGTEAHRRARDWMVEELRAAGGRVAVQAFRDTGFALPVDSLYNVRARFGPERGPYLILGAHWDSRPWADRDPDPAKRSQPVDGANDGASGVAVLLEVARALGRVPPPVGVEIALFDAEDAGDNQSEDSYSRGAQAYVERLGHPRPMHVIIVDMVGRRGMELYQEGMSRQSAPNLVDRLWDAAGKVGAGAFHDGVRHTVYDDHVPFIRAGIPAVDLIDMDDPAWHTSRDLPANCDPASLAQVGRVLLWHVYTLELDRP